MNGLIWLSGAIYPEGKYIPGAFSRSIEILFCFANSQSTHYVCIILIKAQINELPNPAHNKARACMAESELPEVEVSSLQSFSFDHAGHTLNSDIKEFFVCHFDECEGHFHRVQMWRRQDPSWFQESIGVQKGRVNVHLLAWRDSEPAWKERQTTDFVLGLVYVCVCVVNFHADPTEPPSTLLFVSFPFTLIYSR